MGERLTEGVLLQVDKTTVPGATWVTVAELTSIDGPNWSRTSLDRTKLAMIGPKRFRPGRLDGGEVSLEYTPEPGNADHLWLMEQRRTKVNRAWRVVVPGEESGDDDFYILFEGFLTAGGTSAGGDDEFLSGNVTIKVDGDVEYDFES